jgi:hypothetical protein
MRHHDYDALPFIDIGLKPILVKLTVDDMAIHPFARKPRRSNHLDARLENVRKAAKGDTLKLLVALFGKDASQSRHRALAAELEDPDGGPREKLGDPHGDAIGNQIHKPAEEPEKVIFEVYVKSAFFSHVT